MDEELIYSTDEDISETEDEDILETDMDVEDAEPVVETEETVEVVAIDIEEEISIGIEDAVGWVGGDSTRHYSLYGRDERDQHPITAITGLREELDDIEALDVVYSDARNQANYYLWEDENVLQENRVGYFVSVCSDINEIEMCTSDNDIFGVTVDGAGFIGAQSDVPRDIKYGLVVTNGIVHVRCEQPVEVGDYVVSNDYGYAKKNNSGYKVVGRHQIDGIEYAEITLVTPIDLICSLSDDIENVNQRMGDAETNIAAAINVANAAYNKAGEVGEISEEAIKNALEALNKSNETAERTDNIELSVSSVNEIAVQARAISESAELSAERIRSEAVATANNALSEAYNTQDSLDELKGEMTPLTQWEGENGSGIVGFVARANADSATLASLAEWKEEGGDSQSLAGTIAKVNEHEAVLDHITSHQGVNSSTIAQVEQKADDNSVSITNLVASVDKYSVGEYSQAYGLTYEQAKNILKEGMVYIPIDNPDGETHTEEYDGQGQVNEFTEENCYVWNGLDWDEYGGTVVFQSSPPANSSGAYEYWYLNSNTPMSGYEAHTLYIWEAEQWQKVNTLAGNASNRAVSMIRQTTNEIAVEVEDARGDIAGLNIKIDENREAQVAMVASVVGDDGKVTAASIVQSVNDSDSSVSINADKIVMTGTTTFLTQNDVSATGSTVIDGGRINTDNFNAKSGVIGGWSINSNSLFKKTTDFNISLSCPTEYGEVSNSNAQVFMVRQLNADGSIAAYPFTLSSSGRLSAQDADIKGKVTATSGEIGGCAIVGGKLQVPSAYIQNLTVDQIGAGTNDKAVKFTNINAAGGEIGGWNITSGMIHKPVYVSGDNKTYQVFLQSPSVGIRAFTVRSADGDYTNNISGATWAYSFYVTRDGFLYANNADIKGKITATSGSFTGTVTANSGVIKNGVYFGTQQASIITSKTVEGGVETHWKTNGGASSIWIGEDTTSGEGFVGIESSLQINLIAPSVGVQGSFWYDTEAINDSDYNKKNSISHIYNQYEVIFDNLRPVLYKYNNGTSNRIHTGFIAQEVVSAIESAGLNTSDFAAVCYKKSRDGDQIEWGLRYGEFVSLNTWQIQKTKTRIAELENRVAELEKLLME